MKCSYCNSEIEKGTGMMFVRKNGAVRYYCSQRCYKFNIVMDRKPNRKEIEERSTHR
ncbi:MAG: 50S ribosomal protein L24e [Candidatus Micrarchaeota archaeon]|nr:50S ribosomal protein L24e [Candidatus Micrarchaeota archaeon]